MTGYLGGDESESDSKSYLWILSVGCSGLKRGDPRHRFTLSAAQKHTAQYVTLAERGSFPASRLRPQIQPVCRPKTGQGDALSRYVAPPCCRRMGSPSAVEFMLSGGELAPSTYRTEIAVGRTHGGKTYA